MFERLTNEPKDVNKEAERALESLRHELQVHKRHEESQSYLGNFFSNFNRGYRESGQSLNHLVQDIESAKKRGDEAALRSLTEQSAKAIEDNRKAIEFQTEVNQYGGGFLKAVGLFARGPVALATTVAAYGLDQAKPTDSFSTQFADGGLGATKGLLMKGTFSFLGKKGIDPISKGVLLGMSSRVVETSLSRETFMNNGQFDLAYGLRHTSNVTLNLKTMAADGVIFGLAHGAGAAFAGKAVQRSPFLSNIVTGTTFGASSGAGHEIMRQHEVGEFDMGKIFKRAAIQAALDGVAAAPGGFQADAGMRTAARNYAADRYRSAKVEVGNTIGLASEFSNWLVNGGQPQYAFAMAGAGGAGMRYRPMESWQPRANDHVLMMQAPEARSVQTSTETTRTTRAETIKPSKVEAPTNPVASDKPVERTVARETGGRPDIDTQIRTALDRIEVGLERNRNDVMKQAELLKSADEVFGKIARLEVRSEHTIRELFRVEQLVNRELQKMHSEAQRRQAEYERKQPEMTDAELDRWYAPAQVVEDVVGARLKNSYLWNGKDRGSYDRSSAFSMREGIGLQGRVFGSVAELLNRNFGSNAEILAQLARNGVPKERASRWIGLGMPDKSAADLVGADYLLIHRPSGEFYPLDLTLRAHNMTEGRIVDSKVTNPELFWGEKHVPRERERYVIATIDEMNWSNRVDRAERVRRGGLMDAEQAVRADMQKDLARVLGATIAEPSPLSILRIQLPSADPNLPASRKLYEMWRFKQQLQDAHMYEWIGAVNSSMGYLLKTDARAAQTPWREMLFNGRVRDAARNNGFQRSFGNRH